MGSNGGNGLTNAQRDQMLREILDRQVGIEKQLEKLHSDTVSLVTAVGDVADVFRKALRGRQ